MENLKSKNSDQPRMEVIGQGSDARVIFYNPGSLRPSFAKELSRYLAVSRNTRLVLDPNSISRPQAITDFSPCRGSGSMTKDLARKIRNSSSLFLDGDL